MIQITPHMRILLAFEPVDFHRGIDGLAATVPPGAGQRSAGRYAFRFPVAAWSRH